MHQDISALERSYELSSSAVCSCAMTEATPVKSTQKAATKLPSVEEVVDMSLPKAMQWCFRLGIDCEEEGLETASHCKERLLQILKENGVRGKSQPVRTEKEEGWGRINNKSAVIDRVTGRLYDRPDLSGTASFHKANWCLLL